MQEYLNIFVKAAFIENMALAYFLGMCTFLACSKKIETAIGLGFAVVLVQGVTVPLNNFLYNALLKEGALAWLPFGGEFFSTLDLSFLTFITFIGSIAATVQLLEMVLDRFVPTLYVALGVFLPLITVNCAILGGSLLMQERDLGFGSSVVFGLGTGVGWALAVVGLAAIREKLAYSNVPEGLRGLGLAFIITGLMAIGFMSFGGIQL
jgi:Na+-transporting NADH:ubiquinone oxidoreductase subunit E